MAETEMLQVMDAPKAKAPAGLKGDDLKAMFRAMVYTRMLDQRGMNLQRQGRIGFYVPSFGQEASQIGDGYAMAKDIIDGRPYQRLEDLDAVKGIGPKTLEKLEEHLVFPGEE